jgi:hypothetical protein
MKLNEQTSKGVVIVLWGIVIVVLAIILFGKAMNLGNGIFEFFGLKDDSAEAADTSGIRKDVSANQQAGNNSAWSPGYYKLYPGATLITVASAQMLAKRIYDSVGYIYDTPSQALSAIKQINSKVKFSFMSEQFTKAHQLDLLSWMEQKFDTKEQKRIFAEALDYVSGLPKK